MQHGLTFVDVLGLILAFVLTGGLLGYLKHRLDAKRQPVELSLVVAQTERERLVAAQLQAQIEREERESIFKDMREALRDLREECERAKGERDRWEARARAAEGELEMVAAEERLRKLKGNGKR